MSSNFREHHAANLRRSRDALTNAIVHLESAVEGMTGEDWLEAESLRRILVEQVAPRLSAVRDASQERFDGHRALPDYEEMRAGRVRFPDERERPVAPAPPTGPATPAPDPLGFPNAQRGAEIVARHGSVTAARMASPPNSPEFDDVQAFVYVSTGKRPQGWIPPIVRTVDGRTFVDDDDEAA